jgi:hypothetical protein
MCGPSGGMCARQPPTFSAPSDLVHQPTVSSNSITFSGGVSQYYESTAPIHLDLESGGFALLMAISITAAADMTLWAFENGASGLVGLLNSGGVFSMTYTDGASTYSVSSSVSVALNQWQVLGFRYTHASSAFEVWLEGTQVNADNVAQASVRLSAVPPLCPCDLVRILQGCRFDRLVLVEVMVWF